MCAFMLPMDQLSLFRTAVSVTAFKNGHFGTLDSVTVLYYDTRGTFYLSRFIENPDHKSKLNLQS